MSQPTFIPEIFAWYQVARTESMGGETGTTYAMRVQGGYVLKTLDWQGVKEGAVDVMASALTFIPHPPLGAKVDYPPPADPAARTE